MSQQEYARCDCAPSTALAAAYDTRDWEACLLIIEQHWVHLLFGDHIRLLVDVLFALPDGLRRSAATVRHLAEAFSVIPVGAAPDLPTEPSDVAALAASDRAQEFVSRATAAFMGRRVRGHHRSARSIALATAAVLDRTPPVGGVSELKAFAYLQAGLTAHKADDPEMAVSMFTRAWGDKAQDGTGFAARGAALRMAIEAAVGGEPEAAGRWLARADRAPRESRYVEESFASAGIDLARLLIALDSTDPNHLDRARPAVAENTERDELWPVRTWALTRSALMRAAAEGALTVLPGVEGHLDDEPDGFHRSVLAVASAEAYLALGQGTRALSMLARAKPTRYFGRVTEARFALLAGAPEEARALATETLSAPGCSRRTRVEALLVHAVAELRLGSSGAAASAERAVWLLRGDGPRSAVLSVPRSALAELVAAAPDAAPLLAIRDQLPSPDLYPDSIEVIRLTKREVAVLDHLVRGVPRAEIARTLFVSENTVKQQVRSLYAKLGASSRTDAVARAQKAGLLGQG